MTIEDVKNEIEQVNIKIEEIVKKDIPQMKSIQSYETFRMLYLSKGNKDISKTDFDKLEDNIKKIDFDKLEQHIEQLRIYNQEILNKININWINYNENYKLSLFNSIVNFKNNLYRYNISNIETLPAEAFITAFNGFYDNIMNIEENKRNVLENFAYTNKNYIIFGKNGSGKTKLLNHVRAAFFNENSFVIPANRTIKIGDLGNIKQEYNKNLNELFNNMYANPIDVLSLMMYEQNYKDMENKMTIKLLDKFINLFNSLNLERKIKIKDKKIFLYNDGIEEYYASMASDGEKTIMLYIMYILFLPQHAYVFIDEPENHLNGSLLSELFDTLEKERNDVVFLYCTHNIDFIETRNNVELIQLDKFESNNQWIFNKIEDFNQIPYDLIIKIIGTKKTILFIEGVEGSIDFKIYSTLFPEYKIVCCSSCKTVINNCKSISENKILCREAIGIIDNDFRTTDEIKELEKNKIYVLDYSEIENLLLSEEILTYAASKNGWGNNINIVKEAIIKHAIDTENGIVQDFIGKVYNKMITTDKITYSGNIEDAELKISKINKNNKDEFVIKLKEFINELKEVFNNKDYNLLIKKLPNKGFLSKITNLGFRNSDAYIDFLVYNIKEDEQFKKMIRDKIV
jgi:ABC-type lipoprotein export system ATPase subunit